jgi:hypothetical protein
VVCERGWACVGVCGCVCACCCTLQYRYRRIQTNDNLTPVAQTSIRYIIRRCAPCLCPMYRRLSLSHSTCNVKLQAHRFR